MLKKLLQIIKLFLFPNKISPSKTITEIEKEMPKVDLSKYKGGKDKVLMHPNEVSKMIRDTIAQTVLKSNSKYLWLLDNGHGSLTKGKRSPVLANGERFFEYAYNRKIVRGICIELDKLGIDYINVVPEDDCDDILAERVKRANSIQSDKPKIFVSVHFNAASGNSKGWTKAKGIETWHFHNSKVSESIAEVFQRHLIRKTELVNRGTKSKPNKQFYVLRNTEMPAVLTENGFFNNRAEVVKLMQPEMIENIIVAHVAAIVELETKNSNSCDKACSPSDFYKGGKCDKNGCYY